MSNTTKDLLARIAQLEAEVADAKSARRVISAKSNDRGIVSVYGIRQRFPLSYYPEEWDLIFSDAVREKVTAATTAEVRKAAAKTKAAK